MAKKASRNIVPVGTHVSEVTKLGLQALAESQNTTVYGLIKDMIEEAVAKYERELRKLDKRTDSPTTESLEEDDSELL